MAVTNIFGRDFYQGLDADMATCTPRVDGALFWATDTLKLFCYSGAAWNEVGAGGGGNVATDVIWDAKGDLAAGTGANTASKLSVGTDGKYLKADSGQATGLIWDVLANHDHSGDAGDGGTFDAANLTAGASTDGQVLTSDGVGGAAWEDAVGSGDVTWAAIQASQLINEVMNFPSYSGIDVDLDAANLWWDKIDTPSTAVTMVDVAGEAGITETYEYALKTITDASGEGFYQRYTYADQPRIKSGRKLSAIAAVWVGTSGRTITMKLITSAATEVSATATAQAWTVIKCEDITLDGTYVDLKFTIDGADTFYVVPLGCNIGTKAVPLKSRGNRYIDTNTIEVLAPTDPGGASWTDVDCTAATSNLCYMIKLYAYYQNDTTLSTYLVTRRNGSSLNGTYGPWISVTARPFSVVYSQQTDDGQIIEYDTSAAAGDTETVAIYTAGYWEWE